MNKDLEKFENRSDDWLAKERKEESKVSAWDFDEGRRIKEFHEENCEAKEIKERHEKIHSAINQSQAQFQSGKVMQKRKNGASPFIAILFVIIGFNVFSSIIAGEDNFFISPLVFIIFACIFISILSVKRRK